MTQTPSMSDLLKQNLRFYKYWETSRGNQEFDLKTAVKPSHNLYHNQRYGEILPWFNAMHPHNQQSYLYDSNLTVTKNSKLYLLPASIRGPINKLWQYKDDIYLIEDGFMRCLFSVYSHQVNGVDIPYTAKFRMSYCIDDISAHFNIYSKSRLEIMLNNSNLNSEQIARAKNLRQLIVDNCITKYNYQPMIEPKIGREGKKKILVLDQSRGDQSILLSGGLGQFDKMLETAVSENPDCDVIIKVHPDALAGGEASSCFDLNEIQQKYDNVILYADAINPVALLKYVDKVYVCSSGMGFEALLAGKPVITFACPFYAGWGVTDDRHPLMQTETVKNRRQKQLSIDEILYQTYIAYSHYIHPEYNIEIEIEDAIDYLIKKRTEFFNDPNAYVVNNKFNDGRRPAV